MSIGLQLATEARTCVTCDGLPKPAPERAAIRFC